MSGHQDARGSIWRRWDPHVHMPGTLFNDQFGSLSVAEALDVLASKEPAIEVVGITDYATTKGFRLAWEAWRDGAGSSIKGMFVNVELRLDIQTGKGPGVNLHLLCDADQVDGLDRFLGSLEFTLGNRPFRADEAGLIDLGREFSGDRALEADAALRVGAQQFKVSFEAVRKQYRGDHWALEHCLVAVAGGQKDGSSGVRDDAFKARRQTIENFAHIVFSANPQQVAFWLGRGAADVEELERVYGGQKPCLHGSDAHSAAKLGAPDENRYTWLKGDPSFETLRMACLAPETRAHIGETAPTLGYRHGRIEQLAVDAPWFVPGTLPVNPGLVAIIGARGSGKTALADLMAAAAGSEEPFDNAASFISRASGLLSDTEAHVEWSHGEASHRRLTAATEETVPTHTVRYLSQQFVERLCAIDGVSGDLLHEIERVVFNAWPVAQRQGATNFQELLALRLRAAKEQQERELEAIAELGASITEQRLLHDHLPTLEEQRRRAADRLRQLQEQVQELTRHSQQGDNERLTAVTGALETRQQTMQSLDRRRTELRALGEATAGARTTRFPSYVDELQRRYAGADLPPEQWAEFRVDYVGDVDRVLADNLAQTDAALASVAGPPEAAAGITDVPLDELPSRSVAELAAEQRRLQGLAGLDARRTQQLQKLNEQVATLRGAITKLDQDILAASGAHQRAEDFASQRLSRYAAYFDALLREETELSQLYAPLSQFLESVGPSVAKLKLSVRRKVDVESWASRGERFLDLRKGGPFRGAGELARVAQQKLAPAWQRGDGAAAAEAIRQFSLDHSAGFREQGNVPRTDANAHRAWESDVAKWLYSAAHVGLSYTLEYDGLSIERLSPGTRGIVLLLLYLAVDREETDPLIIDQPEENLDPESVYTELVDLFRTASQRRQIIMVTHNANLVVNTDVDQVIVARIGSLEEGRLPSLDYLSGGLEAPEIRKVVCQVLEGGAEAFRQRARRLQLHLPT